MAKLNLSQPFIIETENDDFKGTWRELTKKERKALKKDGESLKDKSKDIQKILKSLDDVKELLALAKSDNNFKQAADYQNQKMQMEAQLDDLSNELDAEEASEALYKKRLSASIISDDKVAIMKLGEEYGYKVVLDTIMTSIREISEGN
jgi:hypothetical protein